MEPHVYTSLSRSSVQASLRARTAVDTTCIQLFELSSRDRKYPPSNMFNHARRMVHASASQSLKGLSSRRATWPFALGVSRWQPMMLSVTRDVIDFTRFSTPLSVTCKPRSALRHAHRRRCSPLTLLFRGPIGDQSSRTRQHNHLSSDRGVVLSMQWGCLSQASPPSEARCARFS